MYLLLILYKIIFIKIILIIKLYSLFVNGVTKFNCAKLKYHRFIKLMQPEKRMIFITGQ